MSSINQEPILQAPGNVIHIEWNDNITEFTDQVKALLQNGDMVMVDYHKPVVYRWNKETQKFMRMIMILPGQWNVLLNDDNPIQYLIDGEMQVFFVKASDLHYTYTDSSDGCLYLKCEGEWFEIDYHDDRVFIKNNEAPMEGLYNVVAHNMISIEDNSWDYIQGSDETNPWTGWNTQEEWNIQEESDMEIDKMMEVEEQVEEQVEDQNGDEYTPSVVGEEVEREEVEEDYEDYEERREDVDGGWYTRRQFYDYYGSDEAWDDLDPSIYHQRRFDDHANCWVTREECYQHYGTYGVWKRMNPIKVMKRKAIWDAYTFSRYIPQELRRDFICHILQTYQ